MEPGQRREYLLGLIPQLPPLQELMLRLDVALTGKDPADVVSQYHHYPKTLEKWMQEPGGNPVWYLSDGGYSRVAWSPESGELFLTYNSTSRVKIRWDSAVNERQAVQEYLNSEYHRMLGEAEDPKKFLKHNRPNPLPDGDYTVYIRFAGKELEWMSAEVEEGHLVFVDAPWAIGDAVNDVAPNLEGQPFFDATGEYTGPIEDAVAKGITRGEVTGIAGAAQWNIARESPDDDFPNDLQVTEEAACLVENLLCEAPEMATIKKHKVKLEPEEREQAMKAGAVWHHSPDGSPTCAIWKAVVNGKTWYGCNTHRCYQAKPTLRGAISAFKFVKSTA